MHNLIILILLFFSIHTSASCSEVHATQENITWDNSLSLPDINNKANIGIAGAFSGICNNMFIVAGGANFPDATPWNGGIKKWHKTLYTKDLSNKSSQWQVYENILPKEVAYGCSISLPDGILCIGGCDSIECSSDVYLIKVDGKKVVLDNSWPSLPIPLSNATASIIDNKVYIAGGQNKMKDAEATSLFFSLDILNKQKGWTQLASWPGQARGYAVSASQSDGFDKCFYLFSGRNYNPKGATVLQDGFCYNPRLNKWKKLSGVFPVMAGTAVSIGANHIMFLGGVPKLIDGSDNHPGFDNSVRLYHTITNTLITKEVIPYPIPVTTNVTISGGKIYLGSGEVKPGIRTPHILNGEIHPNEKSFGFLNMFVILLYFGVLAFMGYYFSKKQKNADDYFRGGGRLPWWAVGLSIFGTSLSAITFMAIPAKSYSTDWSYIFVNAGIIMVVPIIIYLFIPFYRKLNVTTAYEYLELRFNPLIRRLCSAAFILFQIGRMGIVLFLPAIALNVVTGFDIYFCIALMGVLSLAYTMMGGIEAVVWTDALQVVVLLGGAILVIVMIAIEEPGGMTGIISDACADNKFYLGSTDFDLKQSTLWTVLIATFFTNITTYGTDQTMVQRYMTTQTEGQARKSVLTNAVMTIPATVIFFLVGTILYVFYKDHPEELSIQITDGDAILPWYIFTQLPQGVTGLLISGIFAAAMSTLSSSMNSAATAYITDIHSIFMEKGKSASLNSAKVATLILGIAGIAFALMMATWEIKSLWDEFNKILGLVLGSFGGLFLLGLLTKKANSLGALCGIIGSMIIQLIIMQSQAVHLLLYTATGFISCFLIGYLVSIIIPGKSKDISELTIYKMFTKN